jgi:hypothetical protein
MWQGQPSSCGREAASIRSLDEAVEKATTSPPPLLSGEAHRSFMQVNPESCKVSKIKREQAVFLLNG